MCNTTVINRYKDKEDIYIGRGSKWGNPFIIGKDGNRSQVIEKYRQYLWDRIKSKELTKEDFLALEGKKLGCYCKPQACHGDILVNAINYMKNT